MTKEEAIKVIEDGDWWDSYITESTIEGINADDELHEALDLALAALRPVSREQVEQVWRGCQECKPRCGLCVHMGAWDKHGKPHICERCEDFSNFESDQRFCEVCGAPMTDKAVEMVMERLEGMKNETN